MSDVLLQVQPDSIVLLPELKKEKKKRKEKNCRGDRKMVTAGNIGDYFYSARMIERKNKTKI